MVARALALRDAVALLIDVQPHALARGHVGTVVERISDELFEVEFRHDDGRPHSQLPLHRDSLLLLHHPWAKPTFAAGATSDLPSWEPPPPSDPDPVCWDAALPDRPALDAAWEPHYSPWPGGDAS